MRFEIDNELVQKIQQWQDELDDTLIDNIIYETLDSVIDLIVNED